MSVAQIEGAVQITYSAGGIVDSDVASGAAIAATKLKHRYTLNVELFGPTTSIAALTKWLHIVRGATGTLVAVEVAIAVTGVLPGNVTVDLQKSTGGGAFATVLASVITIAYNGTVRTANAGSFSSTSLVDGDILEAIVAISGAGTVPQGLMLTLTFDEDPA